MSHQVVLLSPYPYPGQYPLTLADEEMACWLNGYTLMWHPALLWQATEAPKVESPYDHENPRPGVIYVVPESPPSYLPENWKDRLREAGSLSIVAAADRPTTLENLRVALEASDAPPIGWREALAAPADMLSLFFGLGLGYLLQATLAEAMEHENLLDRAAFWDEVQKAVGSLGSEEPEPGKGAAENAAPTASADSAEPADSPEPSSNGAQEKPPEAETPREHQWLVHLQQAAQKLQSAREVLYPVTIHWLDLHLLTEDSLTRPWPAAVELGMSTNLVAPAALLESLARQQPEKVAVLRAQVEKDLVEICGGTYREREDVLLPLDSQVWNLREGQDVVRRLLGKEVRVFARRTFGFHPRLPMLLSTHGLTKLLFLLFDDSAAVPTYTSTVIAWTAPDGKQIDAFVRPPKPADKAETYFNLGNSWFKTTREDHHATICLQHGSGPEAPWYRDLIALGRLAPVLGTWTTFSRYFGDVSAGEYPPTPTADDFHFDFLGERTTAKLADPVSGFARHLRIRRRIDACWTYAALHRALAGGRDTLQVADHLDSLERVFETQPQLGTEPGGLVELEQLVTTTLAERLQARAASGPPGYLLLNPCGFARRYALELEGGPEPLPVDGHVKACQLDGNLLRAVVEVPALGFAWIPRSGPVGTPPMAARLRMGDPKTLSLRNEFFEVEVDGQTGGLKAIRDHRTHINRLGQKLVFNPGSRMYADTVRVTQSGPALGEIVSEGSILGDQDQELAHFKQRFRVWLGRPLLELQIELTPRQPPAGYPWHAYYGARFAWRDERTHLFRGWGGAGYATTHPRPQTGDYLDLRFGPFGTTIFPGGLPFHQKQEGRMLDVILVPEGETTTTFDLGIALDRDQPMLTAWGVCSPLAVVPTTKGPPHVGAAGWLFHLDMPSLLLTRMLPGVREQSEGTSPPEPRDAIVAQLVECSGQPAHAELRCLRNPTRAAALDGLGRFVLNHHFTGDTIYVEASPHDWTQIQIEF